jgi:FkbM family methyltransferase
MGNNFVKQVIENGGSIHPLLLPSTETGGTGIMNPSIFIDGNKILCNIRHVNYTLFHCEGEQLFGNRHGPLAYINPENDIKLRTNNFLCELNKDFTIKTYNKIDTTKLDIEPVWEFIGLEDARVVRWEDKLFFTGVRRDTKTNGEGRMELSEIVDNKEIRRDRIEPPNDPNSYCEKNWMPVLDIPYHYVKWTNPTELVKVDRNNGTSETIHLKNGFGNLQNLRGSSHIIPYKNKRICIIHECDLWKNKLNQKDAKYTHRFVMWDLDWNIEWISDSFSFMDGEIEFCCGLAEYNNELLISFGFQDNAAFILRMPTKYFEKYTNVKFENKKEYRSTTEYPTSEIITSNTKRKKIGFDVGACKGESIHKFKGFDKIYAFEPAPYVFDILTKKYKNDSRIECHQIAISDEDTYRSFNYHNHYGYSSFLEIDKEGEFAKKCQKEDPGFDDVALVFDVQTKRLDTFMQENHIEHIDFLKIDTQGTDLNVIKSLGKMINKVDIIEAEVQIKPLYKNSFHKEEIIDFMEKNNFNLILEEENEIGLDMYERRFTFKRKNIK